MNSIVKIDGETTAKVLGLIKKGDKQFVTVRKISDKTMTDVEEDRITILTLAEQNEIKSKAFIKQAQNKDYYRAVKKNTIFKTVNDLRILNTYLDSLGEKRSIEEIPYEELCPLLCKFFKNVKKSDGNDYEPTTVRGFLSSFDRHLRQYDYGYSIVFNPEFTTVREVLHEKLVSLKREGKGTLPNQVDTITEEEIEILWQKNQLGDSTPACVINTLWFYFTVFFELSASTDHYNLRWGDIKLCKSSEEIEYLQCDYRQERARGTTLGKLGMKVEEQKLWANTDDQERCVVRIYKKYSTLRPRGFQEPDSPFYLVVANPQHQGGAWFRPCGMGANKLASLLKRMVEGAGISTDRRLSNQSVKKHGLWRKMGGHLNSKPCQKVASIRVDSRIRQEGLLHHGNVVCPVQIQDLGYIDGKTNQIVLTSAQTVVPTTHAHTTVSVANMNGSLRFILPKPLTIKEDENNNSK